MTSFKTTSIKAIKHEYISYTLRIYDCDSRLETKYSDRSFAVTNSDYFTVTKAFQTFHQKFTLLVLLGRVALVAQRPIVVKLSSGRSVGLSVRSTYVRRSVGLSSALWQNGGSDPNAVWHHRSDWSRDEASSRVWGSFHGKGYFWERIWAHHCNQWGLYGVHVRQRLDAALFPNYFWQTCYRVRH